MELSLSMNYVRQGRPGIDQKISDDKTIILDGEEIVFYFLNPCLTVTSNFIFYSEGAQCL